MQAWPAGHASVQRAWHSLSRQAAASPHSKSKKQTDSGVVQREAMQSRPSAHPASSEQPHSPAGAGPVLAAGARLQAAVLIEAEAAAARRWARLGAGAPARAVVAAPLLSPG